MASLHPLNLVLWLQISKIYMQRYRSPTEETYQVPELLVKKNLLNSQNSQLFGFVFQRITKSTKHPIHPYCVVTIVVAIRSVVNCMVTGTHYWPYLSMYTIVDICSPYSLHE